MIRAARRTSPVRFVPMPPTSRQEWRRRVEAAHAYAPLPELALHIVLAVAVLDPEVTKHPMSRRSFTAIRDEFGPSGLPRPTLEEFCAAVCELHARGLAAPWWIITPAQLDRYGREGS